MGWTAAANPARSSSARRNVFSCETLSEAVLLAAGRQPAGGSQGNRIAAGSVLSVAEGQCALLVSRGKAFDLCAEPGTYTYDGGAVPAPLSGELGQDSLKNLYPYAADAGDIRLYYVRTRAAALLSFMNKTGIPFNVRLPDVGLDADVSLFCEGVFRCRVCDPALFFTNVTGPVADRFDDRELNEQLQRELEASLPAALMRLAAAGTLYPSIQAFCRAIEANLAEAVDPIWRERRGLCLEEPALRFVRSEGMGVRLFQRWLDAGARSSAVPEEAWFCPECGTKSTGRFCPECGKKKPE